MKTTTRVLVRVAACAILAIAATTTLWPASPQAQGGAPKYEVDTSWPQPWPERWVIGPIGTACVDSKDHVLLLNRQDLVDTDLGFKFSDVKILLGNHAHGDHQEGDALVKQLTGAQVMVMAEDVPALQAMKPGGKEHPIDKILHDGEKVTLGGTTLVAHLTAGHTSGCTTWTTTAQEGGRTYNVVFSCSLRSPATLTPTIVAEMNRSFKVARSLPCDVQVGDHPAQYNMHEKYAKLQKGGPNPFIDPAGCHVEADIQEAMFKAVLAEQPQAARP
jgi:metallo-beta-lactamase class B